MKENRTSLRTTVLAFLLAAACGVLLHGLFDVWPCILTEFIAPVNESIWEHSKIILWPLLAAEYLLLDKKRRVRGFLAALLSVMLMLLAGWLYHIELGGTQLIVDLLIYVASLTLFFVWRNLLKLPLRWEGTVVAALLILIGLIVAFTVNPPHGMLFRDPILADAWVHLAC